MFNIKMIVGLGNPTKEFKKTRHNLGYTFIERLAQFLKVNLEEKKKDL